MDATGITPAISLPVHTVSTGSPVIHHASAPSVPQAPSIDFNAAAAEQRRKAAVQQMAQSVAENVYVVSDKSFTIFKDASGQFITRFTNLRDGRVTYIPEPQLVRMTNGAESVVQIKA